jgi:hypothetical protein
MNYAPVGHWQSIMGSISGQPRKWVFSHYLVTTEDKKFPLVICKFF